MIKINGVDHLEVRDLSNGELDPYILEVAQALNVLIPLGTKHIEDYVKQQILKRINHYKKEANLRSWDMYPDRMGW